jgi:hypothetical protein
MDFGKTFVWQTLPFWMSVDVSFFADVFEPGGEVSLRSAKLEA